MREDYYEHQEHLASYLKHIAKIEAAPSIAIMSILNTSDQILTMMDYIYKRREESTGRGTFVEGGHYWSAFLVIIILTFALYK